MADPTNIPPPPPGFTIDAPVYYGAPPTPAAPYQGPQAAANLQRTQQEVQQAQATAAANTQKAKDEAASTHIDLLTKQEAYAAAHPQGTGSTVVGPDSLKSLSVPDQELVKALAEGRLAFPGGFALKAPWWQQKLEQVAQYDPSFDATNFNNRAKARAMVLTGKVGASANALNTAIGHLGVLADQAGQTASHDFVPLNAVENFAMKTIGDPGVTNFQDTAQKLADELESVYRNGGGAEAGVVRQLSSLSPNLSAEQKQGIIRNALELLASKQAANLYQYNIGSGGKPEVDLLDPAARAVLDRFPDIRDKYFSPAPGPLSPAAAALLQHNGGQPPPSDGGMSQGGPPPPMPNDPHTPASGGTKDVYDASLTPVRREYMARLQAGQSAQQLVSFLRQAGVPMDSGFVQSVAAQARFRQQNPNVPIQQYDTAAIDHHVQQMGGFNQFVDKVAQSGPGAAAIAAGNAILGDQGPNIIGALGGNREQAQLATQYSAQDHPGAALTGSILGGTAATMAGEGLLGGAGMAPGFARSMIADSGYGALAGSGSSPDNPLGGAVMGGLAGAAGSVAGQGIAKGLGGAVRGVSNADVSSLLGSDVPLTIGQAVGGKVKALEDKLMSAVGGGAILARRAEGVRQFNTKAFDKALEPIGQTVNGQTGADAIATAQDKVTQAFRTALQGKVAVPDQPFVADAASALGRLNAIKRDNLGPEIVGQINEATKDLFDPQTGAISGENMQTFLESLRQIRQSYKNDPLSARVITPAIKQIEKATEGMFERQAPEVMPAYNAAKQAYRRVSILSDAVNNSNAQELVTPRQLRRADINNAKKYENAQSAAAGNLQFRDLTGPASRVLPSNVPNSGTTDRLAALRMAGGVGALATTGAGVGYLGGDAKTGAESGLGLAGLLAMLYTRKVQSGLVSAAVKRGAKARAAGTWMQKYLPPVAGAVGASLQASTPSQ